MPLQARQLGAEGLFDRTALIQFCARYSVEDLPEIRSAEDDQWLSHLQMQFDSPAGTVLVLRLSPDPPCRCALTALMRSVPAGGCSSLPSQDCAL